MTGTVVLYHLNLCTCCHSSVPIQIPQNSRFPPSFFFRGFQGVTEAEVFLDDSEEDKVAPAALETVVVDDGESAEKEKEPQPKVFPVMMRAMALNKPESGWVALGIISALLVGSLMPIFSLIYSEILRVYSMFATPEKMRQQISLYCALLGAAGVLSLTLQTLKVKFLLCRQKFEEFFAELVPSYFRTCPLVFPVKD